MCPLFYNGHHSAAKKKKKDNLEIAGKWKELETSPPECGNRDPERHAGYILTLSGY